MKTRHRFTQTVIHGGAVTGQRIVHVHHDQVVVEPLSFAARLDAYRRQNNGRQLTSRQERQLSRMSLRAHHHKAAN